MLPTPLVALSAGLLAGAAVLALRTAFTPAPSPTARSEKSSPIENVHLPTAVGAVVAIFVVLVITGWLVPSLAVGALIFGWRWLFVVDEASGDRAKVEAVAKWLEDLRDVIRRSSVSPEEALELVAEDSSGVLSEPLARFVLRRRQGVPLGESLVELAEAIAHPTSDAAVAAIMLVIGGGAGGGRLYDTVDELAEAARNEAARRDEIDRLRRVYQRAMRRLIVIVVAFIAALYFFAESLVEPYRQPGGQLFLFIPVGVWAGCLVYMRSLTRYDLGQRYRLKIPTERVE